MERFASVLRMSVSVYSCHQGCISQYNLYVVYDKHRLLVQYVVFYSTSNPLPVLPSLPPAVKNRSKKTTSEKSLTKSSSSPCVHRHHRSSTPSPDSDGNRHSYCSGDSSGDSSRQTSPERRADERRLSISSLDGTTAAPCKSTTERRSIILSLDETDDVCGVRQLSTSPPDGTASAKRSKTKDQERRLSISDDDTTLKFEKHDTFTSLPVVSAIAEQRSPPVVGSGVQKVSVMRNRTRRLISQG